MDASTAKSWCDRIVNNICLVIKGKEPVVRRAVACWLAGGHCLFEDLPGSGKTMLARALAASVEVTTRRVQFTPDLLPGDIIGSAIYSKEANGFRFLPGPLFTTILLADELNRGTPRTQSALLQAMAEGQVTAENATYELPKSFFVIATQNPIEQHGTFPLPEAQLDRFMMKLSLGYPDFLSERDIVRTQLVSAPIDSLQRVCDAETWASLGQMARRVEISEPALNYAIQLVQATRTDPRLDAGCSPRASIAIVRAAQAASLMQGENFVRPDTLKQLAPAVMEHRLLLSPRSKLDRITPAQIMSDVLKKVHVPIQ